MGLFKQVKNARDIIREAPGTVIAARDLAAQSQALGAAQLGQFGYSGVSLGGTVTPDELTPIAGISLERYAQLSKTLGERRLEGASFASFLAGQGHTEGEWQEAYDGWNARMKANLALSTRFGALYQQTAAI